MSNSSSTTVSTSASRSGSANSSMVASAGQFFRPWEVSSNLITPVAGQDIIGGRSNTPLKQQARYAPPKIHSIKKTKSAKKKSKNPSYSIERRLQRENELLQVNRAHNTESGL